MLNLTDRPRGRKCDGTSRREFLQAGTLALAGLTLPDLLRARAAARQAGRTVRDTSVVLLFLDGGASQLETFDPKTEVPKEYRSLFGAIPTALPGVRFGSQFPQLARRADRLAVLRTLTHKDGDHGGATHWMKTGRPWPPEALGKAAIIPQQSPSMGSVAARARGSVHPHSGVPTYVRVLNNHQGYPGDDAVWLGQAYSPFRVGQSRGNPLLDDMTLKLSRERLDDRRSLLRALDRLDRAVDATGLARGMDGFQQQAVDVLLGRAKEAFDLSREPAKVRDRYGPGLGQELLLARRLCEAGAGFVTLNNGYWDHHGGIIPGCQKLCPPLDHAVAAFLDDVQQRGRDRDILLVVTGEFGRTPRLNGGPGRDHWAPINCALLSGGGLRPGVVVGESDEKAAYPKTRPLTPQDLMATVFHVLGLDPELQFIHPSGRPMKMVDEGQAIAELV
jgi:uncharacterized protein (DUF1501 family)